jgi:predicted site-specific integrase-resolvase
VAEVSKKDRNEELADRVKELEDQGLTNDQAIDKIADELNDEWGDD